MKKRQTQAGPCSLSFPPRLSPSDPTDPHSHPCGPIANYTTNTWSGKATASRPYFPSTRQSYPRRPQRLPCCYSHASPSPRPTPAPSRSLHIPYSLCLQQPPSCTHLPAPRPRCDAHLEQNTWSGGPWTIPLQVTDPKTLQGGPPFVGASSSRVCVCVFLFLFLVKALLKHTL